MHIICFGQRDQILGLSLHTRAGHGDDGPVEGLKYQVIFISTQLRLRQCKVGPEIYAVLQNCMTTLPMNPP